MRPLPASVALLSTLVVLSTAQSYGKLRDSVVVQCVTQLGVNYIALTRSYVLQLSLSVLPVYASYISKCYCRPRPIRGGGHLYKRKLALGSRVASYLTVES